MSMLKDVVEFLVDTGADKRTATVHEYPNNPDKRLLFKADGTHEAIDTPRPNAKRSHKVSTIADFASACEHLIKEANPTPSPVWFDARKVVVFPDDRYRDESISLDLPASPQFNTLAAWDKQTKLSQKGLVRILRHDLANCVDPGVLVAFRTMSFEAMANTRRNLQHDKQSMDRDVAAQVTGGAEKVQMFVVDFPVFDHADFREVKFTAKVTVDLECETQEIVVQLLPGELKRATEYSLECVRTKLGANLDGATLIAGTP